MEYQIPHNSWLARLTPVTATFFGSLLLSLVAHMGTTLNRDGMQYVTTARAFLEGGLDGAMQCFNWPFLSIAIAIFSQLTGLGLENSAHLLNALFMAGACALLVACVRRIQPEVSWWAFLAVLALPGFNEYRNELIREFGCWFFIMVSFWLALRWSETPGWGQAFFIQFFLGCAALFRPEALAMLPALLLWQCFAAPSGQRFRRLLMLGGLPLLAVIVLAAVYLTGKLPNGSRLAGEIGRINSQRFDAKAGVLASALIDYSRGNAASILLFGSLALIPIKIVTKLGVFIAPLFFLNVFKEWRIAISRYGLFACAILFYLFVLAAFVIDMQFLAGRYVAPILLFGVPFIAIGLNRMSQCYPRFRLCLVVVAVFIMLANVVSLHQGKTHFVEAGKWLAANVSESPRVYIESGRAAYYAGWRLMPSPKELRNESVIKKGQGKYDFLVLEISHKDEPIEPWLAEAGMKVLKHFEDRNKDVVIIAVPRTAEDHGK